VIVLDTNVLSEGTRLRPSGTVLAWLNRHPRRDLFTTAITEAEMLSGLRIIPEGRRHDSLATQLRAIFDEDFNDRILPFDSAAAQKFATIARFSNGKPVMEPDRQIAAIALAHSAAVATRNIKHFTGCGLVLIDPWTGEERS
jgi:predicted nucleic acid-binding protein